MISRTNKHIKKFNQLVEVHDPAGIDPLDTVQTRKEEVLEARKAGAVALREEIEQLSTADFFDDESRAEMDASDTLPNPDEAAASHRGEMLDRIDQIEAALSDALSGTEVLETSDDLQL